MGFIQQKNDDDEEDNGSLQMKNTSGIFIVLAVGGGLGLIVAVIDFLLYANKICVTEKVCVVLSRHFINKLLY